MSLFASTQTQRKREREKEKEIHTHTHTHTADCIEGIMHESSDEDTKELTAALRSESQNVLAPIINALSQLLRMLRTSPLGPRLAYTFGSVLNGLFQQGPFALREAVLRITSIVLRDSPTFLGAQSMTLGSLML